MKVDRISVSSFAVKVECPKCGAELDGWAGDPRGANLSCEECGVSLEIDPQAQVRID